MPRLLCRLLLVAALVAVVLSRPNGLHAASVVPAQPNLIFILSDDLAQGDVGVYGQKLIQTPRLDRMARGLAGDVRPVGAGVSELRVNYGPGYRVYYARHAHAVVLLLCGGDKRTQASDIDAAVRYWIDYQRRLG